MALEKVYQLDGVLFLEGSVEEILNGIDCCVEG
jgi:hypothetical protein